MATMTSTHWQQWASQMAFDLRMATSRLNISQPSNTTLQPTHPLHKDDQLMHHPDHPVSRNQKKPSHLLYGMMEQWVTSTEAHQ
jgi:hypothetical protein